MGLCPTDAGAGRIKLSIIIPCLNESAGIRQRLCGLDHLRRADREIILVDGGSDDGTVERAADCADRIVSSSPGRAVQMNRGASSARGDVLWFLHLDSDVPAGAAEQVLAAAAEGGWGRFDVTLSGRPWPFRLIEFMMNQRSRLSGIATGDQGIFVRRDLFDAVGGFPEIALMEDIAISRQLKRRSPPVCLSMRITTSSRRWERHGILRTVLLMWFLRLAYFFGLPPRLLARLYPSCPSAIPARDS